MEIKNFSVVVKRLFGIILAFVICVSVHSLGFAEVIKNPSTPLNKNSKKVLKLKEVMKIVDTGEDYYFKYPSDIKIAGDGSIFVRDEKQLLKFDSQGKFKANFHKYGQGPNEALHIQQFCLEGNKLIFFDSRQDKIVMVNHETGKFIKEFRINISGMLNFVSYYKGRFWFLKRVIPESRGRMGVSEIDMFLSLLSPDAKSLEKKANFPQRRFHIKGGNKVFDLGLEKLFICPAGEGKIYVSHRAEYAIKRFNFETQSVELQFSRDYERVEVTKETRIFAPGGGYDKVGFQGGQMYEVPVADHHPDIRNLLSVEDKLWVFTSRIIDGDNGKMVLVDVFDRKGKYVESFYLQCPADLNPWEDFEYWLNTYHDKKLYAVENDREGLRFIRVYQF